MRKVTLYIETSSAALGKKEADLRLYPGIYYIFRKAGDRKSIPGRGRNLQSRIPDHRYTGHVAYERAL